LSAKATATVRSRDEIADAIGGFTPAQLAKLRKVAQYYSYAMPADDLLQEAFARALGGDDRHCPADVDVVRFLAEAMRSIANGEYKKARSRPTLIAIANHGNPPAGGPAPLDPPDLAVGIDDWLSREQHAAALRKEAFALFEDDPLARDILEGRMAEMTADELRELTGLDETAYASKLKLIRRRIDAKFPKGWKS
jgi:DNA-directed RNA polymerase specialized sigma24 family protein